MWTTPGYSTVKESPVLWVSDANIHWASSHALTYIVHSQGKGQSTKGKAVIDHCVCVSQGRLLLTDDFVSVGI